MAMFSNATQFVVNGGEFNAYQSSQVQLKLLLRSCALEATHESKTAAYAPKCKKGTRKAVIRDITKWVTKGDPATPVLWFSGAAGGGKTCIQRKIAEQCHQNGVLAASYFFSTRVPNLDKAAPFIATIVQQLTERNQTFKSLVANAIEKTPSVLQKSLVIQVEELLLNPLQSMKKAGETISCRHISIDGLDECRDPNERKHLLAAIRLLATNTICPFRIIVASRREYDIRTAFERAPLTQLTYTICLNNYDGSDDIRDY